MQGVDGLIRVHKPMAGRVWTSIIPITTDKDVGLFHAMVTGTNTKFPLFSSISKQKRSIHSLNYIIKKASCKLIVLKKHAELLHAARTRNCFTSFFPLNFYLLLKYFFLIMFAFVQLKSENTY